MDMCKQPFSDNRYEEYIQRLFKEVSMDLYIMDAVTWRNIYE